MHHKGEESAGYESKFRGNEWRRVSKHTALVLGVSFRPKSSRLSRTTRGTPSSRLTVLPLVHGSGQGREYPTPADAARHGSRPSVTRREGATLRGIHPVPRLESS